MENYEAPELTVIGTVEDLTEAQVLGDHDDGVFSHREFRPPIPYDGI
jgi:hypothetical protein